MEALPGDLIRYIAVGDPRSSKISENFLEYRDVINLSLCSKILYKGLKQVAAEYKKWNIIRNMFPDKIINMIGTDNLMKANIVDWNERWLGGTGYIDGARPSDLSGIFSIGKDLHGRSFIFVKFKTNEIPAVSDNNIENTNETPSDSETNTKRTVSDIKRTVLTVFQRYTDSKEKYVFVESRAHLYILEGRCSLDDETRSLIRNIIQQKDMVYERDNYFGQEGPKKRYSLSLDRQ